jgi:hypothetical protein
MNSAL